MLFDLSRNPVRRGAYGEYIKNNYRNSGYNVIGIATIFPAGDATYEPGTGQAWGEGAGQWVVDYPETAEVFWGLVDLYKPIAVMSFSRDVTHLDWVMEFGSTNLGQADWRPDVWTQPPIIGGSNNDPALPNQGRTAQPPGNPPDVSVDNAVDLVRLTPRSVRQLQQNIITAIEAQLPKGTIYPDSDVGTTSWTRSHPLLSYFDHVDADDQDASKYIELPAGARPRIPYVHFGLPTPPITPSPPYAIDLHCKAIAAVDGEVAYLKLGLFQSNLPIYDGSPFRQFYHNGGVYQEEAFRIRRGVEVPLSVWDAIDWSKIELRITADVSSLRRVRVAACKAVWRFAYPQFDTLVQGQIGPNGQRQDNFVSGFMGYHSVWYEAWSTACKAGWHTHVGQGVKLDIAQTAFRIQFNELVKWLDSN